MWAINVNSISSGGNRAVGALQVQTNCDAWISLTFCSIVTWWLLLKYISWSHDDDDNNGEQGEWNYIV